MPVGPNRVYPALGRQKPLSRRVVTKTVRRYRPCRGPRWRLSHPLFQLGTPARSGVRRGQIMGPSTQAKPQANEKAPDYRGLALQSRSFLLSPGPAATAAGDL